MKPPHEKQTPHCERCQAPLVQSGSGICAACSVETLFGLGSSSPPEEPAQLPRYLLNQKYQLGDLIGEGGFGRVYQAKQARPVERNVAIKVLKTGTDQARFEAEGQALASLDHPGIAKIFDSGIDSNHNPFLVMELVPGKPITAEKRSLENSLKLFIKICEAVQHAHQRGIIHRDLKPSNILADEEDQFKIIDFGIAKATQHLLTEKTVLTEIHQFMGTPGYVSPEQAGMRGLEADTRTDIYSLGSLLHEMLTGAPPFKKRLEEAQNLSEILRIIQEEEPPRPAGIPADLGWIILKALAKKSDDRYSSASELAREVRRFLNHEPVEAHGPGHIYQLKKFVFRNKAISLGLVFLLGGLVMASYGLYRARQEAREAAIQAERASRVVTLINEMFSATDPTLARNANYTVRQLLDDHAKSFQGKLDDQPEVELSLQRTLANAYQGLGEYQLAEAHHQRALVLGQTLEHPDLAQLEFGVAQCLRRQGRYQAALEFAGTISKSIQRDILLAELSRLLGNAQESHQKALKLVDRATTPQELTTLALTFAEVQDFQTANQLCQQAIQKIRNSSGKSSVHLISPYQTSADIADLQKNTKQVSEFRQAALEIAQANLPKDHPTRIYAETRAAEVAPNSQKKDLQRLITRLLFRAGKRPETLKPLLKIGARLFTEGDAGDARALLSSLLDLDYDKLTSSDRISFQMGGSLVGQIVNDGQIKDFLPLVEETHQVAYELFGEEGAHTLELKRVLAYMYRWIGDYDRSLSINKEAFFSCQKKYGIVHGTTINCLVNLTETLWDHKRDEEAWRFLIGAEGALSEADRIKQIERLAIYYLGSKRMPLATSLFNEALKMHLKTKPADHADCLRLQTRLIEIEYNAFWLRRSAKRDAFLNVFESHRKMHGADNQTTALAAFRMTADRGMFLGLPGSISFLQENLGRAQTANAPQSVTELYSTKLRYRLKDHNRYQNNLDLSLQFLKENPIDRAASKHQISVIANAAALEKRALFQEHLEALPKSLSLPHQISLGNSHWRLGHRDQAKNLLMPLLPAAFQPEKLSSIPQRRLLQTAFQIYWEEETPEAYWKKIDSITDRLSQCEWPLTHTEIIIPRRARWFCHDRPTPPRPNWNNHHHDFEPLWKRGQTPFSDLRFPLSRRLEYRSSNRLPSACFRHNFEVTDPQKWSELKIRLSYPAGAVLWLNGVEIARKHLPENASTLTYGTRPSLNLPLESEIIRIPASALRAGTNSLAAQIHRLDDKSGLHFNLQLEALKK